MASWWGDAVCDAGVTRNLPRLANLAFLTLRYSRAVSVPFALYYV
jgi:hypothetical protein